ncbi:uncharacterized protein LOC131855276 [Achroia grisella]|uniref:uncharacterized protein LOC131855276 n=1 Tax=Achroia grisella TaxID=688607 RepID=UPI0027D1F101|nr:uncharacterized protein LOC131855276 [Achroia grisella]
MAFMMPVVKNDWDIYNSRRSTESGEKAGPGGRVRKVSESRSEGPAGGVGPRAALSPHRSAPAMRSLSYCRAPPSRGSLRADGPHSPRGPASRPRDSRDADKFHTRTAESPERSRCAACMPYL